MNRIEELEASEILKKYFNDYSYQNLESPDLQNTLISIGIEVTQSIIDAQERLQYYKQIKNIKRMSKDDRVLFSQTLVRNEDCQTFCEYPYFTKWNQEEIYEYTKRLIKQKIMKFQLHYEKFKNNGLFLFIRNYPFDNEHILSLFEYFAYIQKNDNVIMNLLFVYTIDYFYVFDIKSVEYRQIDVAGNEPEKLQMYIKMRRDSF